MKAVAAFPAEQAIRLIDHPEPVLERDTEALLRVLDVGVCGTDREIARFDYGTAPAGSEYLVMGHESLAEVVRVAPAVVGVRPGDLVVTRVRRPCEQARCPACAMGRPDFCVTGDFTERGINKRHGFMTELVADDRRYLHVVPRALARIGVLIEPLTIAEKGLIEVVKVENRLPWLRDGSHPSGRAMVLGAGPVGLLGAMALLVRGFETWVYSLEPADSPKAAWVRSVGAEYVSANDTDVAALGDKLDVDLMYEATGASGLAFRALAALGTNGVFIFTGVPGRKAPIELDAARIMRNLVLKNQVMYGTVNAGPDAFEHAITDLQKFDARWPDAVRALITGRFPPERCTELLSGRASGIKQVISFGEVA